MINADLPAFPVETVNGTIHKGLTKREYFAAMVMQGLLLHDDYTDDAKLQLATDAVFIADVLLNKLAER